MSNLISSAGTLEAIENCISKFYMGEKKTLKENHKGRSKRWTVHNSDGSECYKVIVILKAKRFRFEMTD